MAIAFVQCLPFLVLSLLSLFSHWKHLSRAFRNRLIELHFENLPQNELETIIGKKCHLPKFDVRKYSFKRCSISRSLDLKRASLPLSVNPVESLGEISFVGYNVTPSVKINATITNSFSAKTESSSRRLSRNICARRKRRLMKTLFSSLLKEVHSRHERSGNTSTLRAHRLDSTIETIGNARCSCRSFRSTDFTRRRNGMRKNNDLLDP